MFLKICGIKTVEEARVLAECGIDFIGLNFIPNENRRVEIIEAKRIIDICKAAGIRTVALFRDPEPKEVADILDALHFDFIQFNGDEDLRTMKAAGLPIMKSIGVDDAMTAQNVLDSIEAVPAAFYILDRKIQGQGEMVNLELVKNISAKMPNNLMLAGGINPENLEHILRHVHPTGIDISSGVRDKAHVSIEKVKRCKALIDKFTD